MAKQINKSLQAKLEERYDTRPGYIIKDDTDMPVYDNSSNSGIHSYDLRSFISATLNISASYHSYSYQRILDTVEFVAGNYENSILEALPPGQIKDTSNDLSKFIAIRSTDLINSRCVIEVKPLDANAYEPLETADVVSANGDASEVSDTKKYEVIQGFIDNLWTTNNMRELLSQVANDTIVKGLAVVLVEFGNNNLTGSAMSSSKDDINFKIIDPNKIVIDPACTKQDLSDARFIYTRERISYETLCGLSSFRNIKYEFDKSGYKEGTPVSDYILRNSTSSVLENVGIFCYYALYRKTYDEDLKRNIILFSEFVNVTGGGLVVLQQNTILNIDEFPFTCLKAEASTDRIYPRSPVMAVIPTIEAYMLKNSLATNAVFSAINPTLIAAKSTGLTESELLDIQTIGTGAVVRIESNGQISQEINYLSKQMPTDILQALDRDRASIQESMGVNNLEVGDAGSTRTSGAMSILNSNAEKQAEPLLQAYAIMKSNLARIAIKLLLANSDSRTIIFQPRDPNSEHSVVLAQYNPDDFIGIDVDFAISGKVYSASEWSQEQQRLLNISMQQQALGANNKELISMPELMEYLELPNKQAAALRLAETRSEVVSTKMQIIQRLTQNYATVWNVVNNIYRVINNQPQRQATGQFIAPFTDPQQVQDPTNPNLGQQVMTTTIGMFQKEPQLSSQVPFNQVLLYLSQDHFNGLLSSIMGTSNLQMLQSELQQLQATPDLMSSIGAGNSSNGGISQQGVAQQVSKGQATPQPQGELAPQPSQQTN